MNYYYSDSDSNDKNNSNSSHFIWWKRWWYRPIDDDHDVTLTTSDTNRNDTAPSSSSTTPCAQPLHIYAYLSVFLVVYMYFHRTIRTWLLTRSLRHRPSPASQQQQQQYIVPFVQQRYDQIIYSLIIVYICVGLSFVQSCRNNSIEHPYSSDDDVHWQESSSSSSLSVCQETCPYMIQALTIYISMIELTILAYIIPMLCLPCIYFYLLRHGHRTNHNDSIDPDGSIHHNPGSPMFMMDPDTFVRILNGSATTTTTTTTTRRSRHWNHIGTTITRAPRTMLDRFTTITHPFLFSNYYTHFSHESNNNIFETNIISTSDRRYRRNRKVRVQDIMDQLECVQLTKRQKVDLREDCTDDTTIPVKNRNNDIDIYEVVGSSDIADGISKKMCRKSIEVIDSASLECCICMNEFMVVHDIENHPTDDGATIVRTPKCHHLFHRHCIQNWIVGGQWWEEGNTVDNGSNNNHHQDEESNAITVTTHLLPAPQQQQRQSNRHPPSLAYRTTCPLCRTHLYRTSTLQPQQQQTYGSTL